MTDSGVRPAFFYSDGQGNDVRIVRRRDVALDRFDRANLLGALRNLEDIAHDVGIRTIYVQIMGVDYDSAVKFDPDAKRVDFDENGQTRAFTSHQSKFGDELRVSFLTELASSNLALNAPGSLGPVESLNTQDDEQAFSASTDHATISADGKGGDA